MTEQKDDDTPAPDESERENPDAESGPETVTRTAADAEKTPEQENAELKDRLLRSLAENENLMRRARRDREDAMKYAASNFARDMLSVADNLRRAMDAVPDGLRADESAKAVLEGIDLTQRELLSTLERHGIKRISPLGEKFNHDRHEALFEVPTADADPGTVVQVVEDGYMIHDRLLRAARVGVAKAPPAAAGGDAHRVDTTA